MYEYLALDVEDFFIGCWSKKVVGLLTVRSKSDPSARDFEDFWFLSHLAILILNLFIIRTNLDYSIRILKFTCGY